MTSRALPAGTTRDAICAETALPADRLAARCPDTPSGAVGLGLELVDQCCDWYLATSTRISTMFTILAEDRLAGRRRHHVVTDGVAPLPVSAALRLWQHDDAFRDLFIEALATSPFQAFRWETPPVTVATVSRPLEFVLVDSPELDRPADASAFRSHFTDAPVVTFENLGGDALMIVPCPDAPVDAYAHLAAFVRRGPSAQVHALWTSIGQAVQQRLGDQPLWLSTAGGGVAWLHVRLDSRPKYYAYSPYK